MKIRNFFSFGLWSSLLKYKPIKTAVEVEADLKTDYLTKLKIDDRNTPILSNFLMGGWTKMIFGPCFYSHTFFNYLMFFPS